MQRLRSFLPEIFLTLALVGAVSYFAYLAWGLMQPAQPPVEEPPVALTFSGERALEQVERQLAFGHRITGSPSHRAMGDWMIEELQGLGWHVLEQPFTVANGVAARNIIAIQGQGPAGVIGAHYDTRMVADADPDPALRDQPVPGANDGASGVAVLLELARTLDVAATGHTICLLFFDAEDNGRLPGWDWILGSTYFVENLAQTPACAAPRFAVIVDMIGDADQQVYVEQNSTPSLSQALWSQAAELGYGDTIIDRPGYSILDDHTPFLRAGIPAADMIDFDYPYWHTTGDTLDKVSGESLERIGRTVQVWLERGAPFVLPE